MIVLCDAERKKSFEHNIIRYYYYYLKITIISY